MELILSSILGAISAIIVALINSRTVKRKKDQACEKIINSLNVDQGNIYIVDSNNLTQKSDGNMFKNISKANNQKIVIFIK